MDMETYFGYIKTPQDALIIFEACRRNQLARVQRRLSAKERIQIRSGSIFAWDEREAGMRRWTDGRTWSPSRVLGSFLTYRELDTKRRPRRPSAVSISSNTMDSNNLCLSSKVSCSYKPNGLIKQSFSICTATNQKLHLISYYSKSDVLAGRLQQPSMDHRLRQINVPKGLYPELNPLDTSGGHSATLHSLRQQQHELLQYHHQPPTAQLASRSMSISSMTTTNTTTMSLSMDHLPPASPPSLSSSPSTCDDDIMMMTDSLLPTPTHPHPHPHPLHHPTSSSPFFSSTSTSTTTTAATTPTETNTFLPSCSTASPTHSSHLLPIQDIAWEKLPSSEDSRQLRALQNLLKL
ncbi:Gti1/Pac2 family-domain-containing protein [Mycotypha africana]|uniref:Gti1/Pac2 family-domain-containing protein n=1 Tax=Mycotypha africana TaxID=64632 RepID=UPI0022FFD409|nr:Gti1/Pac2 family-domain-containing protein [Mycotypha africana]KAI8984494.1 Gti1/Pac2 family-domain-containing protein [Mycotypha africana]